MMKKSYQKPGFESVFYIGILLLMVLPALVFAQQGLSRSLTIVIKNKDTIINGKNINTLKPKDRKEALKAFNDLATDTPAYLSKQIFRNRLDRRMPYDSMARFQFRADTGRRIMLRRRFNSNGSRADSAMAYHSPVDSNSRVTGMRMERYHTYGPKDHMPTMRPNMNNYRMPYFDGRGHSDTWGMDRRAHDTRERQDFEYRSTDKNNFSTGISFHVSAAPIEIVKQLTGTEKVDLDIYNLVFTPEFTTGKTMLMLSLPSAAVATITLTDTDGKPLWRENSTGSKFSKTFALTMNGIYYLVVKQGVKSTVKKVVKE